MAKSLLPVRRKEGSRPQAEDRAAWTLPCPGWILLAIRHGAYTQCAVTAEHRSHLKPNRQPLPHFGQPQLEVCIKALQKGALSWAPGSALLGAPLPAAEPPLARTPAVPSCPHSPPPPPPPPPSRPVPSRARRGLRAGAEPGAERRPCPALAGQQQRGPGVSKPKREEKDIQEKPGGIKHRQVN